VANKLGADGDGESHLKKGMSWEYIGHSDGNYPLVNIQKAIENGHRNSGFSH